jgi:LmbE family N-acetylglucosaminyl deacetylase
VSPYTGRSSPPSPERLYRSAQYRALDIRREIERELLEFRPTLIAMPHGDDQHPDHCSTYLFARDALRAPKVRHTVRARTLLYLVHHPKWPFDRPANPAEPLSPPDDTDAQREHWVTLPLTPDESAKKVAALREYHSQQLIIGKFVEQFYRPNELFVDGPPASPAACWCDDRTVVHEVVPGRDRRPPR